MWRRCVAGAWRLKSPVENKTCFPSATLVDLGMPRVKLKRNGIGRTLLELIRDYLNGQYQRVVLNGKSSSWKEIRARVPQGSVLGPLFFLIYINNLCDI